jgi:ribose transport system permease protein
MTVGEAEMSPARQLSATADPAPWGPLPRMAARWRAWLPYALAAAIYGVAVWISPSYADMRQLGTLLVLAAMLGIVAIGQTLVMLVGGIDLSVAAVITFVNLVVAATVAGDNSDVWIAVPVALAIGLAVGVINGVLIHALRLPDIIMTLASYTILTGVALLYSGGSPKGQGSSWLGTLATGRIRDVLPYSVFLWGALSAAVIFILRRTAPGRRVYAVGLNRRASLYAGVRVGWTVVGLYAASGVCAAIVGVLITGYTGSSYFGSGDIYQLGSVAAVVVGGTSIYGGRGGYGGTIAGTLIIVFSESILRVVNIADAGRRIAYGLLILVLLVCYGRARSLRQSASSGTA